MTILSLGRQLKSTLTYATTSDGWKIALHRYRPPQGERDGQSPVLLCHGLGANRYNLDAPGRLSLARWLCRKGFDCWVIELRGSGKSTRPNLFNRKRFDWKFEHYVRHDVPAALNHIRDATGHEQVHWVGHSMGGMVAYAYLMIKDPKRIRTVTAIASPSFTHVAHPLIDKLTHLRHIIRLLPHIPYASASALLVPFMPIFKPTLGQLFGNPKNLRTIDLQRLVAIVPQDLPLTLLNQILTWYADKGFTDDYGHMVYFEELHRIQAPALIIAGSMDQLTPPKDIRFVYDNIGSDDKQFESLGKESGCRYDYGHIDLVLGKYAEKEVWPHILKFITKR